MNWSGFDAEFGPSFWLGSCSSFSLGSPNIEVYGKIPNFYSMAISPDGEHIAYINNQNNKDVFVVRKRESKEVVFAANLEDAKASQVYFLTNKHISLHASSSRKRWGEMREISAAMIFNLENKKFKPVTRSTMSIDG